MTAAIDLAFPFGSVIRPASNYYRGVRAVVIGRRKNSRTVTVLVVTGESNWYSPGTTHEAKPNWGWVLCSDEDVEVK